MGPFTFPYRPILLVEERQLVEQIDKIPPWLESIHIPKRAAQAA
jgi:hypothetical protein